LENDGDLYEALRVNYVGAVTYSAIKSHVNTATVCVFPSFAEALPVSWIEAMAIQKPIVAYWLGYSMTMG
jgi:glycosyltransferase involved in cell wall biosynthesis